MFLQNNKKGFTLIELLSILGVLGIILLIAVPTYIGINKTVKEKMLETKLKIIEESAITFGESIKETIVNSSNLYKDNLPCKSISISSLVPKYLNKDNQNECITNGSESTIGCIVDPSNTEKYLDKEEVIIYYKNKRIYAVVDTDDTLECVTDVNSLEISTFYLGKDNPNYTITKNIDAYISWDNQNVEYYCVTNTQGINNCSWKRTNETIVKVSHTLDGEDGEKKVYAYIRDKFGNISPEVSDTILLDTTAPTNNSVVINNNDEYTKNINVTLTLSSIGAKEMCISNTTSCTSWETYTTSKNWTLTNEGGTKTVYVWYKDEHGNKTVNYVSDSIVLKINPPTNNSVVINNSNEYTKNVNVTLTLSSTGASEMCISNTTSCTNWEAYNTSKSWTLTSGDGTKTVYVWYRDEYENTSEYVTDTIVLDTAAPTNNSVSINNNATYTTSTSVTLTLSSTGASMMCISNTISCTNWETYATSKSWTLTSGDGTKTVYVWYKDAAGNQTSSYVSDTIILETTIPTVTANALDNNTTSPKISFKSNETGTYCVNTISTRANFSSCILTGSVTANTSVTTSALSSGTYYVHVKDTAGNIGISGAVSLTKILCTSGTQFGTCIRNAKTAGFNSTMEAGLYRYQNSYAENYVCFGTTNKSTCINDMDKYMYRIVGVNSSNQVKILKKTALKNTMIWYSDIYQNITWPQSSIYSAINGSSFLTNTTYVPSGWSSKIATYAWKYGDVPSLDITPTQLYNIENGWTSTVSAKIGLLYVHDTWYARYSGGINCWIENNNGYICGQAWFWLSNNDAMPPYKNEYTMTRIGYTNGAWNIWMNIWGDTAISNYNSIRPVFYLTSSVKYTSGNGTAYDPFIIN